ncbi:endonuclease/exonuclease/phosphatase family protein [Flavobacteriales bacterium]|nr:endonuclease/exonuclease/phosphatase family protein [Flavobacteriales bacterium]
MKKIVFLFLTIIPCFCFSQNTSSDNFSDELFLMFYNVENLFDTIDSPNTKDEEFLPSSEKKWDSYRYNYKLNQLEKVFNEIIEKENEKNLPDIIGLCEVENKFVIEDLLKTDVFKNHNYFIVHKESPDGRGIDCALLVDRKFEVLQNDFIQINNPKESRTTRDIVYSKLKFKNQIINVFVNHWPSRWGGQEASNHKRVFVAEVLRKYIDKNISQNDFNLIMGDFNDYPNNESLDKILVKDDLLNLMSTSQVSGLGSYNYKGNWDWLDQIIVSNETPSFKLIKFGAFNEDFMMYTNKKGEVYPNRSFGGNNWYAGYSDHLPVFLKMKIKTL